jgi:hypothetical protein
MTIALDRQGLCVRVLSDDLRDVHDDAIVTATVCQPNGFVAATQVVVPSDGPGSGTYTLRWDASWSASRGEPVDGEYLVVFTILREGRLRTKKCRVPFTPFIPQ